METGSGHFVWQNQHETICLQWLTYKYTQKFRHMTSYMNLRHRVTINKQQNKQQQRLCRHKEKKCCTLGADFLLALEPEIWTPCPNSKLLRWTHYSHSKSWGESPVRTLPVESWGIPHLCAQGALLHPVSPVQGPQTRNSSLTKITKTKVKKKELKN